MDKKLKTIIALVIILLIIVVPIYIKQKNSKYIDYNGFKVYKTDLNNYDIEIFFENDPSPHYISSRYNPNNLDYIKVEDNLKEKILKNKIYVTLTPELTSTSVIAAVEISKITSNQFLFNIPTKSSLTYDTGNNIIVTCTDVSSSISVITLKLSNKTQVYSKEGCIIIEGTTEDEIIEAATKFTLSILDITE